MRRTQRLKSPKQVKSGGWHQNFERSQGIGSSLDLPSQQTNIQETCKRLHLHHTTPNSYPKFKSEPVHFRNPAVSLYLSSCIKSHRERERKTHWHYHHQQNTKKKKKSLLKKSPFFSLSHSHSQCESVSAMVQISKLLRCLPMMPLASILNPIYSNYFHSFNFKT